MRDVSYGASGHYLPNDVRDDFKGNPEGGYGVAAAFGGSSENGSPILFVFSSFRLLQNLTSFS